MGFEETTAAAASGGGIAVMALAIAGIIVVAALLTCFVNDACRQAFYEAIGVIKTLGSSSPEGKTQWSPGEVKTAPDTYPQTPTVEEPRPQPGPTECCPIPPGGRNDEPHQGQLVFRVWGGFARENGRYWTPQDPHALQPYGYTAELPLPPQNTCERLVSGRLEDLAGIKVNVKPSGFVEYEIPKAAIQVGYPRTYEDLDPGEFCGDKWHQ